MDKIIDIEEIDKKYEDHLSIKYAVPNEKDINELKPMIDELLNNYSFITLRKKYHYSHKRSFLYQIFLYLYNNTDEYTEDNRLKLKDILKIKTARDQSGIISVTVFTSPYPEYIDDDGNLIKQSFSCKWNCSYCPNQPNQPRSYLNGEPGVLRANRVDFNCIKQMFIRMEALYLTGHDLDKLEILVLGGTWTSYPLRYREQFIRDIYYAANVYKYGFTSYRDPLTLSEEKSLNTFAQCKIIGLTLETRPDTINKEEIILLRKYGCTRLQLGIQHIDDGVLKVNNRNCNTITTIKAIELLKNSGYKIDAHFMPNLPGSDFNKDDDMLNYQLLGVNSKKYLDYNWEVWDLRRPDLQVDQWKLYPCTITPYTDIKKWYEEGTYKPYLNDVLTELIIKTKKLIFPFIRLNRCVRDIPSDYVPQTEYHSNMRQEFEKLIKEDGWYCSCIRCREVKDGQYDPDNSITVVREYNASNGKEYYISRESKDKKILYGFVRLRITKNQAVHIFPELKDCAFIRELHVYGKVQIAKINEDKQQNQKTISNHNNSQHRGIGKMLMAKAEEIAKSNNYFKMSVISGIGTQEYYKKIGYRLDNGAGEFMIKHI